LRIDLKGDELFEAFCVFVDDPIEALGNCIRGLITVKDSK